MVDELTPEDLAEASKLFEAAADLEKLTRAATKRTEAVAKIVEAHRKAVDAHKAKLKKAMGERHKAFAKVKVAQEAEHELRHRFVERKLITGLEAAEAAHRKLERRVRQSEELEGRFRNAIEHAKRDKGMHGEFRVKRIAELERQIVDQESTTAKLLEDLEQAAKDCREAEQKIAAQIEALWGLCREVANA